MNGNGEVSTETENNLTASTNIVNEDEPSIYYIKWITWVDSKTPIITQNLNGPCPLLALFNVLLLSKKIVLPEVQEMISSKQIMDYLGGLILEDMPKNLPDTEKVNYEQNMADAISIFPKLQTGIDVNVQFKSTSSFEYTPELVVFDLLRISLYHGWLPDPQDKLAFDAVSKHSYNQVIDHIISSKDSSDQNKVEAGLAAEHFLNSTAAQLTCHGIISMLEAMSDGQLAVLFRNNHFSTIIKKGSELFTLATDQGFLNKPSIVWETLSSVQGDTHFTDAAFMTAPTESPSNEMAVDANLTTDQQLKQDMMLALSLSNEQEMSPGSSPAAPERNTAESDHEMAYRLQREYDQQVASRSRETRPRRRSSHEESNSKCVIL